MPARPAVTRTIPSARTTRSHPRREIWRCSAHRRSPPCSIRHISKTEGPPWPSTNDASATRPRRGA